MLGNHIWLNQKEYSGGYKSRKLVLEKWIYFPDRPDKRFFKIEKGEKWEINSGFGG